jgi:hypothetical protein
MISDMVHTLGRNAFIILTLSYIGFGIFAYWQADPGSNLKLFFFEFTKAGTQKVQASPKASSNIDLSVKVDATPLGALEKACRNAIRTTAEEEAEYLLGNGYKLDRESSGPQTETLGLCKINNEEQNSVISRVLYARSLALTKHEVESRAIFEDLASQGEPHSNLVLGFIYSDYKERSPVDAINHFVKALVVGEPYGAYGLGKYFELGMHALPDYAQAAAMYNLVAKDIPEARFRLAQLYQYGLGVDKDEKEAMRLLRSAATSGYEPAVNILRSLYETH